MAGYRPKSLDELNSLYDKSKNAKNEISKKASDLEAKSEQLAPAEIQTAEPEEPEKSREEVAAEEISGLVDDFIKSFGTTAPVKKVRPASATATHIKSLSAAKPTEARAASKETSAAQTNAPAGDKPKLIRNTERKELFEDYKKVMDDEDDEEGLRQRLGRRMGRRIFEKKNAQAQDDEAAAPETSQAEAAAPAEAHLEDTVSEVKPSEPEIEETLENIDAVIEKVLGKPQTLKENGEEAVIVPEEETADYDSEPVIIEVTEELPEEAEEEIIPTEETVEETVEIAEPVEEPVEETAEETVGETVETDYEDKAAVSEEINEAAEAAEADDDYDEAPLDYLEELYKADNEEDEAGNDEYSADYVAGHSQDKKVSDRKEKRKDKKEAKQQRRENIRKARSGKRFAGKNILLTLLLFTLLLATAVSAVKAFSGINSDTLMLDQYFLFTADSTFTQAGINKGDLVVVRFDIIEEGDVFAYRKDDGEYGFAKFESVLNDETIIADTDGQKSIVFSNTLRGVYFKSIPVIGAVAALIISDYLYVVGALALIAVILLLIIILAFRDKKEKTPKKSRKNEASSESEEAQENTEAAEEEQSNPEDEQAPYDAVEDDFKYLIQEDGDDFDVYRSAPEGEEADEDGLPVYEDYKYEPDEYINS